MKRRQRRWLLLQPRWRGCWPYLHRSQPTAWCAAEKKGLRCWIRERVANNSQTRCTAADGRGGGGGGTGNHLTDISTCSTTSSLFISAVSLHSIRFVKQQQPSAHFPFISSSYRIYFFFFFFFSCRHRHHQSRSNNNKRWNWKSERLLESIPFTVVWLRHCSCSYPAGRPAISYAVAVAAAVGSSTRADESTCFISPRHRGRSRIAAAQLGPRHLTNSPTASPPPPLLYVISTGPSWMPTSQKCSTLQHTTKRANFYFSFNECSPLYSV